MSERRGGSAGAGCDPRAPPYLRGNPGETNMTAENGNDAGLPSVGPLTGEEREQSERLTKSRDALRAEYARVDHELMDVGCRVDDPHTHYERADGRRDYQYASTYTREEIEQWTPAVTILPCPGPRYPLAEVAELVGGYADDTLRLDEEGLWLWVPLHECEARHPGDDHATLAGGDEDDSEKHWQVATDVSIGRLRQYAPLVGPFLESARATLIARVKDQAESNETAAAILRRVQGQRA